jgi:hypothetical protein
MSCTVVYRPNTGIAVSNSARVWICAFLGVLCCPVQVEGLRRTDVPSKESYQVPAYKIYDPKNGRSIVLCRTKNETDLPKSKSKLHIDLIVQTEVLKHPKRKLRPVHCGKLSYANKNYPARQDLRTNFPMCVAYDFNMTKISL